jgi:phage protein D
VISPAALLKPLATHPRAIYRISVDGADITATLAGRLVSLSLTDNRGFEADQLDIELDDTDGKLDLPPKGAVMRVAFGWQDGGLIDKGSFTIDEIEHNGPPDVLSIRARSADLRSGLTTQRERSWHNITLGDLVRTIADENDLQPVIAPNLAALLIDHLDQTNESAANLLTRLARQYDAIATVKDGKLLFINAAGGVSASGKPLPAIHITRESGDRHRFAIADRETYSAVRATYNDLGAAVKGEVVWNGTADLAERKIVATPTPAPATGQHKDAGKVFATRQKAQRAAAKQWAALKKNKAQRAAYVGVKARYNDRNLGVSGEVTYGQADDEKRQTSAKTLAAKDAEKAAPVVALDFGAENIKTLRHVYANKTNAKHAARAEWRRLQRGMATFGITLAYGRPDLFPEVPVTVSGFKPAIDSTDWIVSKVLHTLNDNGLTTAIELEVKAV